MILPAMKQPRERRVTLAWDSEGHTTSLQCLPALLTALLLTQPATAQVPKALPHPIPVPADHAEKMARGLEMFRKDVAPLLREHCLKCHGGEKTKSDFDLATREGLLKGGTEGVAVVPFDSGKSWLMKLVRHEEEPEMPEKKPKLPDAVIAKLAAWIENGAPYTGPLVEGKAPPRDKSVVSKEDRQWWSFQPLAHVAPPAGPHPVDAFLIRAAEPKKLTLNAPADARLLVRRAFLDLTGLPPTPETVSKFERAPSWPKLVDTLLDSPAFGERWARHWLDVARFAESSGFEHDYDRPFAFHYRDFVIKALNADMPYDQFVRWQLAGDEFAPGDPLALMATGFLGAGVFPTQITANEVERTRYDALDDMLSTTGQAFLGLTVGCARCHDHKFDPIPTADYYRMLSTFTTTVRSSIDVELEPEKSHALRAVWKKEEAALVAEVAKVESTLRPAFEQWLASGVANAGASAWTLLEPTELKSNAKAKFKPLGDGSYLVEGENGASDTYTITAPVAQQHITALRLEALTHPSLKRNGPGRAGNGNFGLGKIEVSLDGTDAKIARGFADFEQNQGSLSIAASLDMDSSSGWAVDGQIGKDHAAVFVLDPPLDPPPGAKLTIKLSFTVNTQHSIGRPRLAITSAADPKLEGGALSATIVAAMQEARTGAQLADAPRKTLFDWWKQREPSWQTAHAKLAEHRAKEPGSQTTVMVCAEGYKPIVMHSQGAPFLAETHLLKRGDVNQKEQVATQSFLQVLMRGADEKRWAWPPPKGAQYSGRRRSLANWLTDVDHGAGALLARVAVNRLWQHHFGRGLVATPNDFGKTGAQPSNPELLDWLAGELIRNGWHLKPIHRLIMTSAAYQQSSATDAAKLAADPDNALFLRRTPQRLEAEVVRDSILAVSGLLDRTMFGKGTLDEGSKRRSIYFTVKRSQLVNSMVVFDAPEPLVSQGSRPTTTVAPQALLLMNSPQVRAWAEAFAQRIARETASRDEWVARAYLLALGRDPSAAEADAGSGFVQRGIAACAGQPKPEQSALTDLCQILLALNEFIYVD
jgi:mono/diheme cytochrome c family protein